MCICVCVYMCVCVYIDIYIHIYIYIWVTLLYSRNWQNIVNQLHFNIKYPKSGLYE